MYSLLLQTKLPLLNVIYYISIYCTLWKCCFLNKLFYFIWPLKMNCNLVILNKASYCRHYQVKWKIHTEKKYIMIILLCTQCNEPRYNTWPTTPLVKDALFTQQRILLTKEHFNNKDPSSPFSTPQNPTRCSRLKRLTFCHMTAPIRGCLLWHFCVLLCALQSRSGVNEDVHLVIRFIFALERYIDQSFLTFIAAFILSLKINKEKLVHLFF